MAQRHKRLLLATTNPGKARELRALIDPAWECLTPAEVGLAEVTVAEDGTTYRENAARKARVYADAAAIPALADDSGLEVDALGGLPGVRSARYAGPGSTDAAKRAQLLTELRGVPRARRGARFRAVVALALPQEAAVRFAEGTVEGRIADDERGQDGFGYDPVFELPDGRRMAELSPTEKNAISHRARAVAAAAPLLAAILEEPDERPAR